MDQSSTIQCSVAGCSKVASKQDSNGNLYCTNCWNARFGSENRVSEDGCDDCDGCKKEPKCDVPGCNEDGLVRQRGTGKHYCIKYHAWKADRPEDSDGLTHPLKAEWNDQDLIRAAGMGIDLGIKVGEC